MKDDPSFQKHKGCHPMKEHTHALPGTEITFPSGSYTVKGEGRLAYGDREFLYVDGAMTAGSACCGAVEVRVVHVPGMIVSWQHRRDRASGCPVSTVEAVTDPSVRTDVERLLNISFPSSLIILDP